MAFYTAYITTFFLCFIVDIQAHITTHTVYGQNAQRCYVQFLTLNSNYADRYIKGLPMHGSQLQVLEAMIYVHCMKSIDPQSIHQLLKNYRLFLSGRYSSVIIQRALPPPIYSIVGMQTSTGMQES